MNWLIRLKSKKASIDQPPKPAKLTHKYFEGGLEGFEGSRYEQSKKLTLLSDHSDHWCWPNSPAMNSAEIDIFYKRLEGSLVEQMQRDQPKGYLQETAKVATL